MRAAAVLTVFATCCPCGGYEHSAERFEDADALFHQDPRWLGGDGAYSIDLGGDRTLWLFGDSFIATSPALTRRESTLVRNSVAVMTGRDPVTATMEFAWRDGSPPSSFFPEEPDGHWYWPMHGVRTPEGPLVIFLARMRATPGQGLGFAGDGYRAVRIVDPDAPPSAWVIEPVATQPAPHAADATIGNCTVVDGEFLYAVSVDGSNGRTARYSLAAVAAGDLSAPEWYTPLGFQPEAALNEDPSITIVNASTECSLIKSEYDFTYVSSVGFGASTIGFRDGYWFPELFAEPIEVFTPPESTGERPFVYAAKAHASLARGDHNEYLVTYVDNSFTFADLLDPAREKTLYWPKFVRVKFKFKC